MPVFFFFCYRPQLIFNANVGGIEKISSNLVLNAKNFRVEIAVCEEANKCYKVEVKSIFRHSDIQNLEHELLMIIDLVQLGFDKEFHLKADTVRTSTKFEHDVVMRLKSRDNVQYVYKVYVQNGKASAELVLPKRTLFIESVYQIPKTLQGKYEVSISTYADKANKPNSKTTVGFIGNVQLTDNNRGAKTHGELKFSHPALKELRIVGNGQVNADTQLANGKLEIDIFKNADQAVIVSGKYENTDLSGQAKSFNVSYGLDVSSKGLGFQYGLDGHAAASLDRRQVSAGVSLISHLPDLRVGAFAYGSEESLQLIVTGFARDILKVDGQYARDTASSNLKATLHVLSSSKPTVVTLKTVGYRSIKATLNREKLLRANGEFTWGKEASLVVNGGANDKELFKGKLALDQAHFLDSDYNVNEDEFKSTWVSMLLLATPPFYNSFRSLCVCVFFFL